MSVYSDNEDMMQEDLLSIVSDECGQEFAAEMLAYLQELFAIKRAAIVARNALAARHDTVWASAIFDAVWDAERALDEVLPALPDPLIP